MVGFLGVSPDVILTGSRIMEDYTLPGTRIDLDKPGSDPAGYGLYGCEVAEVPD
jgi:hypothetical protein